MSVDFTAIISWLALFATLYGLYLQRTYNEKSLKPLGQIDLEDRQGHICVRLMNNGMGPLIVDTLVFVKANRHCSSIGECLDFSRQYYTAVSASESEPKVVLPEHSLIVFETRFEPGEEGLDEIRQQLGHLRVVVKAKDVYDNKVTIRKDLKWFSCRSR